MSIYDGKIEPLPTQKKTLTEQWREGKLPAGMYYIKADGVVAEAKLSRYNYFYNLPHGNGHEANKKVEEVLAPVPSYDEYCNLVFQANKPKNPLSDVMMCYDTEREKKVVEPLQKKLAIATKALKEYSVSDNWFMEDSEGKCWSFNKQYPWRIGFKALKEMEGVK